MIEREFAQKLTHELDTGLRQINGVTLQRLADSRRQALARAHALDREWVLAQNGHGGQMVMGGGGHEGSDRPAWLRTMYFGIFLILLLSGILLWQQLRGEPEPSEQSFLDAQMLSGDLPPSTYIHPEFKEWLREPKE